MKRQELLRQLDREIDSQRKKLDDLARQIKDFEFEEEKYPRILGKGDRSQKGDYVFWHNGAGDGEVASCLLGIPINSFAGFPNTIIIRPLKR